jgi:hypothetical protein
VQPEIVSFLTTSCGLLAYYIVIAAGRAQYGGTPVAVIEGEQV